MKLMIILMMMVVIPLAKSAEEDMLVKGCKSGALVTQTYLKNYSDSDTNDLYLRCIFGIKNKPSIRVEFNKVTPTLHKKAYACGVGIGVAASFYNKPQILNTYSQVEKLATLCIKYW